MLNPHRVARLAPRHAASTNSERSFRSLLARATMDAAAKSFASALRLACPKFPPSAPLEILAVDEGLRPACLLDFALLDAARATSLCHALLAVRRRGGHHGLGVLHFDGQTFVANLRLLRDTLQAVLDGVDVPVFVLLSDEPPEIARSPERRGCRSHARGRFRPHHGLRKSWRSSCPAYRMSPGPFAWTYLPCHLCKPQGKPRAWSL
jgi:hypothetical protein